MQYQWRIVYEYIGAGQSRGGTGISDLTTSSAAIQKEDLHMWQRNIEQNNRHSRVAITNVIPLPIIHPSSLPL